MRTLPRLCLVAAVSLVLASGCTESADPEPSTPSREPAETAENGPEEAGDMPDGAIRLRANTPTPYAEGRLVASNIWDDSIMLEFQVSGSVESADLTVGGRATLGEHTFELIEVWEDPDADEAGDGGLESDAVVLPVD
ncbi:hypothetical protein [Bogoriella caseilytica]|uniref:Bacterial spore germination immunoglobulin-like domain-containing protein n=1 Tax=Bogoriella caseilytica TaxID=56055 RepID=A0A3N2BBT7_9MICO|nr:hypothetical protein [Bogoriella caseilytica]ROR72652.1 hypothetical protein EDD31_1010 [Bogoriella caseilytica]